MRILKSYLFKDKDPAIDEFRTELQDHVGHRNITNKELKNIEVDGGPVVSTTRGWLSGKTRTPMNYTMEAAGRAIGKRRIWVDMKRKK